MYTITFTNQYLGQWTDVHIFKEFEDAKGFLEEKGFTGDGRYMERPPVGWAGKMGAYIELREVYKPKLKS